MHRIVHFDLKGAPLKVAFLEKVFKCAKSWGATGVLMEWEDTFPYSGELADIGSQLGAGGDELYSMEEVHRILQCAKENGLELIQLVQTIGHLEFVLKHQAFRSLREETRSPAVLCPSKPEAQALVKAMLTQALEVQPDAKYFHIGADEVWHTAVCEACQKRAATSNHKAASLYLDHIRDLAQFIKQRRPNLTILMWDDMLRSIGVETLESYKLGELVQPVIWNYNVMECFQIDASLWTTYKHLFPCVWAGSAFKGANGSCQVLSPVGRYVSNHEAWLQEIKGKAAGLNFAGVVLTGWSRYDHYATLCELLPVSLPCMAACLKTLAKTDQSNNDSPVSEVLPEDEWPGIGLARCIHSFVMLRERCYSLLHGDLVTTWLNSWQIETGYTNPVQVDSIAGASQSLLSDLTGLQNELCSQLRAVTGRRSSDEWLRTFFTSIFKRITELQEIAENKTKIGASVTPH